MTDREVLPRLRAEVDWLWVEGAMAFAQSVQEGRP